MKKIFLALIVLSIATSSYALKKPVALNKIMTVSQDLQLYKEAASEEESGTLASNEFVAIQKIGPEAIIEGIKSNWVCVYILDEDKFRNGFLYESLTRQIIPITKKTLTMTLL